MPGAVILAGFGEGLIAMPDEGVFDTVSAPSTANAILTIKSDGTWTGTGTAGGQWLNGGTNGAAYDVRATDLGSWTGGGAGFGTWLQLSSNRAWNLGQTGIGTNTGSILLEFRPTGGGATLDTATIIFTADVS